MKFNDKIKTFLVNFAIGKPNFTSNQIHLYADYVELIALFSNDLVSKSDIIDRLYDEDIELICNIVSSETETDIASLQPEIDDKTNEQVLSFFELIKERSILFKGDYPFIINADSVILKENLSVKNMIYLSLLISSHLNYFDKLQPELTSEFEKISYQALLNYLPANAKIKQFGKNSDYKGSAKTKIINLANEIGIKYNDEVNEIIGNQEKGLDLIAWIPFNDRIPNITTILIQCACGKDWYKKQSETRRFEHTYYNFYRFKPIHSMFIPYSLYRDSGKFYQSEEIDNKLLFERSRILENINNTDFFKSMKSNNIVQKCVDFVEDTV